MNRSLLLLVLMPLCALADNPLETQEATETDSNSPTFKYRVEPSFKEYGGKPTATIPLEEVTKFYSKLQLVERKFTFTVAVKEGKAMYGFPIAVQEKVCGEVARELKMDRVVMFQNVDIGKKLSAIEPWTYVRNYVMYNAKTRSDISESSIAPCYNPNHEKREVTPQLPAALLLKKLIEANKQDSSVTSLPAQCIDIKEQQSTSVEPRAQSKDYPHWELVNRGWNIEDTEADYAKLKQLVFEKMGADFAATFNTQYPQSSKKAVKELARHFDHISPWKETFPPQAIATIGSKETYLDGDIANIIYG